MGPGICKKDCVSKQKDWKRSIDDLDFCRLVCHMVNREVKWVRQILCESRLLTKRITTLGRCKWKRYLWKTTHPVYQSLRIKTNKGMRYISRSLAEIAGNLSIKRTSSESYTFEATYTLKDGRWWRRARTYRKNVWRDRQTQRNGRGNWPWPVVSYALVQLATYI